MRYSIIIFLILFATCKTIDKSSETHTFSKQRWPRNEKMNFSLQIKDSALYDIYFIVRHTERYEYTNIMCNLFIQNTDVPNLYNININIPLTDKNGNWMGNKMDDLIDHHVLVKNPLPLKSGMYKFTLEQLMPDDPLSQILNIGIELQKHPY